MNAKIINTVPQRYYIKDNGVFPNSVLPVLLYKHSLDLPVFFASTALKNLFRKNGWTNSWRNGIYTYHHYHSNTHEVCGVCRGKTQLQLGGDDGVILAAEKGDVIVIPAGVAHKNLGKEKDVICVGGYPNGKNFDMNYGKPGERPVTDNNIASLHVPVTDPVMGANQGVPKIWGETGGRNV
jgi:uncharacterized protein YjlB